MTCIVIHKRDVHKYQQQDLVYIGRPSVWGNPFSISPDCTRDEAVAKFRDLLNKSPQLQSLLPTLKGKVLVCWCKPQACHGDIIAECVNRLGE